MLVRFSRASRRSLAPISASRHRQKIESLSSPSAPPAIGHPYQYHPFADIAFILDEPKKTIRLRSDAKKTDDRHDSKTPLAQFDPSFYRKNFPSILLFYFLFSHIRRNSFLIEKEFQEEDFKTKRIDEDFSYHLASTLDIRPLRFEAISLWAGPPIEAFLSMLFER